MKTKRQNKKRLETRVLLVLVLVMAVTTSVYGQYAIFDLGTLGGSQSQANGINNAGQVVGVSLSPSGQFKAFLWTASGGMRDLGTLYGFHSAASGINESGQVVGLVTTGPEFYPFRTFLWSESVGMVDLGALPGGTGRSEARMINNLGQVVGRSSDTVPGQSVAGWYPYLWTAASGMQNLGSLGGHPNNSAHAINDLGQVVGVSRVTPREGHAFLWTASGGMQDLGTLGGNYSGAFDINNSGQVVGGSHTASGQSRAFLMTTSGPMQDLGTLGGNGSGAAGINSSGMIVGSSGTASGENHAFLWTATGGMQDLGTLGGNRSFASAINDLGQVVGWADAADGQLHACIWIPETPESLILDLINGLQYLDLGRSTETSLLVNLNNALDKLEDNNPNNDVAAVNNLQAFINQVKAQTGKKIPEFEAGVMIEAATNIIDKIQGS